ncbi:ABC transporter substrate-binding protein [Bradyrhizobium erythrophlei]|uniref:Amino acid/amide ABC transporter substrate-binding protein, HAAT family n=1 Tax=Bradyrhizobium erythrophlei TaxID=1437360 RepID=A0A1M5WLG1_9BRAD|nr:ABC transporter substrate-binding protein [Bradyrhizobium erythrophlei]SHH88356.1 amino acid/amide ABC transporter substrate-binding protein, HAAT family [Bradyrhizobium erythrophlei]
MAISRRKVLLGSAGALGAAALPFPKPAIAQSEPIKIGWLAAMTGPSSAPTIGFNRGVIFAVDAINAAGGVKGRKIEVITRDTQGDPTKAVNATQELISQAKVHALWGPVNSGEALATTPIMARAKMPNIHPCVVESLIDPAKFPNAFRMAPSNSQWDDAVRSYCLNILKVKKIAVIGDTTGYGVTALGASVAAFKKDGADVVYQANIDATQPDMTPDMLRAKNAGAEVIVVWSVTTGMEARMFNTRAAMNWDVAFVGHPSLASGEIAGLVEKPANWKKVYAVGYKSVSYDGAGKLPPKTKDLVDRLTKANVALNDTLLWWIAGGIDAIELFAKGVETSGSTDGPGIIAYLNSLSKYPGYFGDYTFTPTQHNGYPTDEIVMSEASTAKNGTFALAPGYS